MDFIKALVRRCWDDGNFRRSFFLKVNTVTTVLLALFQGVSGYLASSTYMGALAFYYITLALMRGLLVSGIETDVLREWKLYRACSALLLLFTIALLSMNVQLLNGDAEIRYPWYLIYAVAALCTYNVTIAIIGFFTGRKKVGPVFLANKNFNIIVAAVSLLTLQSAMLTQFGDDSEFTLIMGTSVGMAVFVLTIIMSFFMIRASTRILKELTDSANNLS